MKFFGLFVVLVLAALFSTISGEDKEVKDGGLEGGVDKPDKETSKGGFQLPKFWDFSGRSQGGGGLPMCQDEASVSSNMMLCMICKSFSPDCFKSASGGSGAPKKEKPASK